MDKTLESTLKEGINTEFAERIHGITYHISSSPYYSEDIHTNYTDITLGYYSKES